MLNVLIEMKNSLHNPPFHSSPVSVFQQTNSFIAFGHFPFYFAFKSFIELERVNFVLRRGSEKVFCYNTQCRVPLIHHMSEISFSSSHFFFPSMPRDNEKLHFHMFVGENFSFFCFLRRFYRASLS